MVLLTVVGVFPTLINLLRQFPTDMSKGQHVSVDSPPLPETVLLGESMSSG